MDTGQLTSVIISGVKTNFIDIKNTQTIIDLVYPIGSVYISLGDNDPITSFGGAWEIIKEGHFLEATENIANIGNEVQAGLPNITGTQNHNTTHTAINASSTGAFAKSTWITSSNSVAGTGGGFKQLIFDASSSNPIYGKSNTVQPLSIKCRMWKRIA